MLMVLAMAWLGGLGGASGTTGAAPALPVGPPPVVVELFTSQGCSSCPPADALWRRLADEPAWRGRVLPLTFHVDYWNSLGWRDPFSSAQWSARQTEYARAFGSARIYTPQAVIDGRAECVGSDEDEVVSRIVAAERGPRARLDLRRASATSLVVAAAAPAGAGAPLDVMLAIYERERSTAVGRGENGGRTLREVSIVRRLERAFTLEPGADGAAPREHTIELALDPSWQGLRLGAAVFVQSPATREIFGGRAIDL